MSALYIAQSFIQLKKEKIMDSNNFLTSTVSYKALEKSQLAFDDLINFNFYFYGIPERDFIKFSHIFTYIEGTIYQIDEYNEKNIKQENLSLPYIQNILDVLTKNNALDKKIETEFINGLEYYELERKICSGKAFTIEEGLRAAKLKSTDYRILHRLIYKLIIKKPYDENIFDVFKSYELLYDAEADLIAYEDDVRRNVYNIYRTMVKLYKKDAPRKIKEYMDKFNKEMETKLTLLSDRNREKFRLTWEKFRLSHPVPTTIPEPILND